MSEHYCIVTFEIVQHSLIFEKFLEENGLQVKLMPVPRDLSSSCGTAAYIDCEDKEDIISLCNKNNVNFDEFHKLKENKKSSWFFKYLKK